VFNPDHLSSGHVANAVKAECVLKNAAGHIVATRRPRARGEYQIDLFDSAGVLLAILIYDHESYHFRINPDAEFDLSYDNRLGILGFIDSKTDDLGVIVEHMGRKPIALVLVVDGWRTFKPFDPATGEHTVLADATA
jgi:hypothetical protein